MKPDIWGPGAWTLLHAITLEYPEQPSLLDKNNIRTFFESLSNVLPCEKCRIHFKNNLTVYPLTDTILSSKNQLVKWLIDIHNKVNESNGKPILSYENALKKILDPYECNIYNWYVTTIFLVVIIIFLIVGIILLYNKYSKKENETK